MNGIRFGVVNAIIMWLCDILILNLLTVWINMEHKGNEIYLI